MTAAQKQSNELSQLSEVGDAGGQYLTFMLADEEYGVEILRVQEIKGWDSATRIPNTPEYLLGVLNLRGAIVPIIDLRRRFALESVVYGPSTVVIVVAMMHEDQQRIVGLVVDAVADVYRLDATEIQPPPDMGSAIHADFVHGLATVEGKMVILLDVDQLIDFDNVESVASTLTESEKSSAVAEVTL